MSFKTLVLLFWALLASASARAQSDVERMLSAAQDQVGVTILYAPSYQRLDYPGGDVPRDRGVCTDVLIRALRAVNVDLQVDVHRDMKAHFEAYPAIWGLKTPDPNIDHRRVPNLERYLQRVGKGLPIGDDPAPFLPGDFVSWRLDRGQPHIGMVANDLSTDGKRHLIIHNIGDGVQVEDVLFEWRMTGHFRYFDGSGMVESASAVASADP